MNNIFGISRIIFSTIIHLTGRANTREFILTPAGKGSRYIKVTRDLVTKNTDIRTDIFQAFHDKHRHLQICFTFRGKVILNFTYMQNLTAKTVGMFFRIILCIYFNFKKI